MTVVDDVQTGGDCIMRRLTALLTAALLAGCATAPAPDATHYWESDKASANRYRVDQHTCQQNAGTEDAKQPAFDATSTSYETYRECMVSRGYVLRQY